MINYYLITKPGIIFGNLVTLAAGFFLASRGPIDLWLFMETLLGLAFVIASACVLNNCIDRKVDQKMERTKDRPLASGAISVSHALIFGMFLACAGFLILLAFTNLLAVAVAALGFFVYVVLYSLWKGRTVYSTAIGSVAGAVPPIVGYCAVSHQLDLGAAILFGMMVFWQMPHFFSIAIYRFDDYLNAQIPVLPVLRGMWRTKIHMLLYIAAFMSATAMLTVFGYTGYLYLTITSAIGLAWLMLCLAGFKGRDDHVWGARMFRLSLVMVNAFCLLIPFGI